MPIHQLAACLVVLLVFMLMTRMKAFAMADCIQTTFCSNNNFNFLDPVNLFVLNTSRIIHKTDERFLSFSIDSKAIRKKDHTHLMRNPKMKRIVSYLSPGYLRIGGTEADRLIFKRGNSILLQKFPLNPNSTFYMTEKKWMEISRFANSTGLKLLFDLNVLLRRSSQWDSSNAQELLEFSSANGFDVDWQLGNEPNSFCRTFNVTLSPAQLATDFVSLRQLLDRYPIYRTARLVGPDVTSPRPLPLPPDLQTPPQQFLQEFTAAGGSKAIDAVAWHHYYLHNDEKSTDFLSPAVFDSLKTAIDMVKQAVKPAGKALWLSLAAREGLDIVVRQSLYAGNYALIDKDTVDPNPDYWVAFVYKALVSPSVLSITPVNPHETSTLRLYAHCSANGTAVVFGSNIGNTTEQLTIKINGVWPQSKARFYQLYAPSLLSRKVFLNGRRLVFPKQGEPHHLRPVIVNTRSSLDIKPLSIFFLHLNNLSLHLC